MIKGALSIPKSAAKVNSIKTSSLRPRESARDTRRMIQADAQARRTAALLANPIEMAQPGLSLMFRNTVLLARCAQIPLAKPPVPLLSESVRAKHLIMCNSSSLPRVSSSFARLCHARPRDAFLVPF